MSKAAPRGDKGAPAALKAIEEHELRCREEKDVARLAWKDAETQLVEGDEIAERRLNRTRRQYLESLETWDDSTKKLALFDKQVLPEKREGEKITKDDAEKYFTAYTRHARVAYENTIMSIAQDAIHCATPESFYGMAAGRLRHSLNDAMKTAHTEGRVPAWLVVAVDAGL